MEFLLRIIQLIINDSKDTKKYIKDKIKFSFDDALNHERALNVFSVYAETPQSLDNYLTEVINKNK
jgi:hypothetical protein